MKSIAIILACFVTLMLGACATAPATTTPATGGVVATLPALTPEQIATAKIAALVKKVNQQCGVVQPFLLSLSSAQSQLNDTALGYVATASKYTAEACSAAAAYMAAPAGAPTFNLASVQDALNLGVPALVKAVDSSTTMTKQQKATAEILISAAQLALAEAVANAQ
ncbi:MAG: hypothetical protein JWR16_209 [Nevskia sp.]|nr:hypothetical protein [Nevskia sp.]